MACPVGSWCSGGLPGAQPRACSRGTYADTTEMQACTPCEPGTYQDTEGSTACVVCDDGYMCEGNGTTVQVPRTCDTGDFYNATLDACMACPAGSWCSGGPPELQPRPCSRGMYANVPGSQSCSSCEAG